MTGFTPLAAHTIDIPFLFPKWRGGQLGVNLDQASGMPRELNVPSGAVSQAGGGVDQLHQDRQSERRRQFTLAAVHVELAGAAVAEHYRSIDPVCG